MTSSRLGYIMGNLERVSLMSARHSAYWSAKGDSSNSWLRSCAPHLPRLMLCATRVDVRSTSAANRGASQGGVHVSLLKALARHIPGN